MIKTILIENAEVFKLDRGYRSLHSCFTFLPRTKVGTKEESVPSQLHREKVGCRYFRSLGIDYCAILIGIADWHRPTRDEYRITQ